MMYDIVIIIDKSTFQLLNFSELLKLSNYYKHNVSPILVMEILGDLKKDTPQGKTAADIRVKDFATKLFPTDTIINGHYEKLVQEDLLGNPVSMDGRPNVGVKKTVQSESGMKGFLLEETEEEKAIYKWKQGHFTEADHRLSSLWRTSTTQEDLLIKLQNTLKESHGKIKLSSIEELSKLTDSILIDTSKQDVFLAVLINNYGLDAITGMEIFFKWQREGRQLLKDFAPYAYHCLKVDLFFTLGLQSDLIGTRPTNRVDMEYLYYLPFCTVFTSNDNLHKNIVPYLLRPGQKFLVGAELKKDLKMIVDYLENGGEEIKKKHKLEPPVIEESLTFQLWKEYFDYPNKSNWNRNLDEKDQKYVREKMKEFERAVKGEKIEWDGKKGEEPEFIVKQSWISRYDPCICGSGKKLTDCCMTNEQFDEIAKKHFEENKNVQ